MLKKETIELRDVTADVKDENFVIIVKIFNPEQRTLYAYASPPYWTRTFAMVAKC